MASLSVSGTSSGPITNKECKKKCVVVVCKELFSLLSSVKPLTLVTTMEEVLDALRLYIYNRKLFDSKNPNMIYCQNDDLSKIFGQSEFTIIDIRKLLQKVVVPFPCDVSCHPADGISSFSDKASKRSAEFILGDRVAKRICMSDPQSNTPMFLNIPHSPKRAESASDTAESVQGYETAFVKDTSDDYSYDDFGGESDDSFIFKSGEKVLTIAESFELEYEVETDSSTDFEESDSDSDEALDTIITFVCCRTDSDQEFFADASSDEEDLTMLEDAEITHSDKWTCKNCSQVNQPPMRYCLKCWQTRIGWLATDSDRRPPNPKRRQKPRRLQGKERTEKQVSSSHDSNFYGLPSTSEEGLSLNLRVQNSFTEIPFQKTSNSFSESKSDEKLCLICCSKPVNSSLIHGKYAHTISCYDCGRRLKRRNQGCPICRRTIEKVVHQISLV